jgi:hypothetical protein
MESTLIISAPHFRATAIARDDLPEAVGPMIASSGFRTVIFAAPAVFAAMDIGSLSRHLL